MADTRGRSSHEAIELDEEGLEVVMKRFLFIVLLFLPVVAFGQTDVAATSDGAPELGVQPTRLARVAPDLPFDFPRPSINQEPPTKLQVNACDTTCYCNQQCNQEGTRCTVGSGNCKNNLYCDICDETCTPANPHLC
jgi:hypothetical protein